MVTAILCTFSSRINVMEERGTDGYAPIHIAIKQNDHKLVKVLLRDYCKCLSWFNC